VVFHALIGAYGQAGQWEDSVATFRSLQEGEVINLLGLLWGPYLIIFKTINTSIIHSSI
jgi:pentatricopeptide repeat protein